MKIFSEEKAERFLKKEGFKVIPSFSIKDKEDLEKAIKKFGFPLVMKASGDTIIHKKKIGAVELNIKSEREAKNVFDNLIQIPGCEKVLIQPQIKGEEFILGINKTKEFGQVIAFGFGGSNVEKERKVTFRTPSINKKESLDLVKEIIGNKKLTKKQIYLLVKNILFLCHLAKDYPNIQELDINPLILTSEKAFVCDARILFN